MKKYSSGSFVDAAVRVYGSEADTITSFPATIYADGENASALIYGNMQQSGTPTPSSPIQPSECGDRTGNLWNGTYKNNWDIDVASKRVYITPDRFAIIIPVEPNTDYTISRSEVGGSTYFVYGLSLSQPNDNTVFEYCNRFDNAALSQTVNSQECNYLTIFFGAALSPDIMVNTGSTPLPYEPYGQYKIPISSASTTTPVYLGEAETTRKVKKLVLTGEEEWATVGTADIYGVAVSQPPITSYAEQMCSHFISASNWTEIVNSDGRFGISSTQNQLVIHYSASGSIPNFKSYLQQQYAAGTPVTVWYVLATETTGIVNEPLRKIGDYADSVAAAAIPTTAGSQSFSIDTTLKPSSVSLTYTGWHTHVDKKAPWTVMMRSRKKK